MAVPNKPGNSPNPGVNNNPIIKIDADTKDAMKSLKELERQVDKLFSLANQGEKQQGGFLTAKQVGMYKKVFKEIEQTYSSHYSKLLKMQDDYNNRYQAALQKVQNRQASLNRVKGNNRWGNVSSPSVINFYAQSLQQAINQLNSVQQGSGNITAYQGVINNMASARLRSNRYSTRIGNLHQYNPNVNSAMRMIGSALGTTGAITSMGGLVNYVSNGIDTLRQQYIGSSMLAQRSGDTSLKDTNLRDTVLATGLKNQYTTGETLQAQSLLASGGFGTIQNLLKDVESTQRLSRSYSLDPNSVASQNAALKRIGSLDTGDMSKFAEMIAGSISKANMRGREGEMTEAVTRLAMSVSNGLDKLTNGQLSQVIGLQTQIGQSIPSLSGERGAQLLSGMDASIKSGGSAFDVIMGKGSRFVGLKGMKKLESLKEEGIGNPKTLEYFFQGLDRQFGNNDTMKAFASKELLGISLHDYDALNKAGVLNQWKQGQTVSPEDLRKSGAVDLATQMEQRNASHTQSIQDMLTLKERTQTDLSKVPEAVDTSVKGGFYKSPEWMQGAAIYGGGIGGSMLGTFSGSVSKYLIKKLAPTIGGGGGVLSGLKGAGSVLSKGLGILGGVAGVGATIAQLGTMTSSGDDYTSNKHKSFKENMSGMLNWDDYVNNIYKYGSSSKALESMYPGYSKVHDQVAQQNKGGFLGIGGLSQDNITLMALQKYKEQNQQVLQDVKQSWDDVEKGIKDTQWSHNIKVTVDGKIAGMNDANQSAVKNSLVDYFTSLSSLNGAFKLSTDQSRR